MRYIPFLLLFVSCKAGSVASNAVADVIESAAPAIETVTTTVATGINPLLAVPAGGVIAIALAALIKKLRG